MSLHYDSSKHNSIPNPACSDVGVYNSISAVAGCMEWGDVLLMLIFPVSLRAPNSLSAARYDAYISVTSV